MLLLKKIGIVVSAAVLVGLLVFGAHLWVEGARREAGDRALAQTADWSVGASLAARLMVQEYGPPQWVNATRLEWSMVPPWKRIVVQDAPAGFLEHAVSYRVPKEKVDALRSFGRGLSADVEQGELAARGESEEVNLLCLNLAADIAQGKRTPEEAGQLYYETIRKSYSGKTSPYMQRLLFPVLLPREMEMPLP